MTPDDTLDRFRHAARRKDYGSALALWRTLAGGPGEATASAADLLLAGQAARAGGDFDMAETLLDGVRGDERDNAPFALDHAALATDRRDWPEASRRWRRALAVAPETGGVWFNFGWALQWNGELDEADTVLARARARFPNDERIAVALARNAALRGDVTRSLDLWATAAAAFPTRPHIHLHRVGALREAAEPARAEAAYLEAVASCAPTVALLIEGAGLAQSSHDWAAAAARWRAVLTLDPAHPTAGARLIAALRQAVDRTAVAAAFDAAAAGDHATAIERFRAIDPMDDALRVGLLGSLLKLGRLDEAQAVRHDISPNVSSRAASLNIARLATLRRDWIEAERRWEVAAGLFPDDPEIDGERHEFRRLIGLDWVEDTADAIDQALLERRLA